MREREEPTGLGAVVELDPRGYEWSRAVRTARRIKPWDWQDSSGNGGAADWRDLGPGSIKVLSKGWSEVAMSNPRGRLRERLAEAIATSPAWGWAPGYVNSDRVTPAVRWEAERIGHCASAALAVMDEWLATDDAWERVVGAQKDLLAERDEWAEEAREVGIQALNESARADRAEEERDLLRSAVAALVDEWRRGANELIADGGGESLSYANCTRMDASELAQLLTLSGHMLAAHAERIRTPRMCEVHDD